MTHSRIRQTVAKLDLLVMSVLSWLSFLHWSWRYESSSSSLSTLFATMELVEQVCDGEVTSLLNIELMCRRKRILLVLTSGNCHTGPVGEGAGAGAG